MKADLVVSQRQLAGVTLRLTDAERYAKYVFPFFDTSWTVRFLLCDILSDVPRTTSGLAAMEGRAIRIAANRAQLPRFETMEPERLRGLAHFDPWWALKGGPRLPDALLRAAVATNIASKYHTLDVPRRVEDVAFDAEFANVLAVHTEDAYFHKKTFERGELDLAKLLG